MHFINSLLLSVTFIASVTLLALMQRRKLIGRLLLFFVLLLFYVLRSALLIIGIKVFDRATYLQIASLMSLVDLGLQLAIAYLLTRSLTQLRRVGRGPANSSPATSRLWNSALFLFAGALLLAGGLTLAMVSVLPDFSPVPLDRGVVFSGLVFLLLFFVRNRDASSPEGRLLTGFCVVSAANILSQWGKTMAAAQHDPRLFLAWAYGSIAVWICVLVFWILRLQPGQSQRSEQRTERLRPLVGRRVG